MWRSWTANNPDISEPCGVLLYFHICHSDPQPGAEMLLNMNSRGPRQGSILWRVLKNFCQYLEHHDIKLRQDWCYCGEPRIVSSMLIWMHGVGWLYLLLLCTSYLFLFSNRKNFFFYCEWFNESLEKQVWNKRCSPLSPPDCSAFCSIRIYTLKNRAQT